MLTPTHTLIFCITHSLFHFFLTRISNSVKRISSLKASCGDLGFFKKNEVKEVCERTKVLLYNL